MERIIALTFRLKSVLRHTMVWPLLLSAVSLVSGCLPLSQVTSVAVTMSPSQVVAGSDSTASGSADITVGLDNRAISGDVTLSGLSATAVTLSRAYAGTIGSTPLVSLTNDADNPDVWHIPAFTVLSESDFDALWNGELYLSASSDAYPMGEVRGQVLTDNISLLTSQLEPAQVVPPSASAAGAKAFLTLNQSTRDLFVNVNLTDLGDATDAALYNAVTGSNGGSVLALSEQSDSRWSLAVTQLSPEQVTALSDGQYYIQINSASFPDGDVRGQVAAFSLNDLQPTLDSIQANIFDTQCVGCHSPTKMDGNLDLSSGNSETAMVNVPSSANPALLLINPGDPASSYLVDTVVANNLGRMPLLQQQLSQSQIDAIETWISDMQ